MSTMNFDSTITSLPGNFDVEVCATEQDGDTGSENDVFPMADAALSKSQQLIESLRAMGLGEDDRESAATASPGTSANVEALTLRPTTATATPPHEAEQFEDFEQFEFERRITLLEDHLNQVRWDDVEPLSEALLQDAGLFKSKLSTQSSVSTFLSSVSAGQAPNSPNSPSSSLCSRETKRVDSSDSVLRELREAMLHRWPEEVEVDADTATATKVVSKTRREDASQEPTEAGKQALNFKAPAQIEGISSANAKAQIEGISSANAKGLTIQGISSARTAAVPMVTPANVCRTTAASATVLPRTPRSPKLVHHKVSVTHTYNFVTVSS
jgi:hypothetical protein